MGNFDVNCCNYGCKIFDKNQLHCRTLYLSGSFSIMQVQFCAKVFGFLYFLFERPTRLNRISSPNELGKAILYSCSERFCKILQNSARLSKILQGSTRFCKTPQNSARFCKILQDSPRFCQTQQDFARFCKVLQDSSMLFKILQDSALTVIGFYCSLML